ncbi:MAG: MerR family transcriptional regulator [Polyangia bacterium]|jgi:hypothetical protein|nr:MerR family transcriptional regulator [Polyangia bacterium]
MVIQPGTLSRLKPQPEVVQLEEEDILALEARFPDGVSSADILRIFQRLGMKLSEGTFRKYVQLGLLSRSKRIGMKGKHRGSIGLYPTSILRQIVAIKKMMAEGLTIEQLQKSWVRLRPRIEAIETDVSELIDDMAREVQGPHFEVQRREKLQGDLEEARVDAKELIQRLLDLEQEVSWSPDRAKQPLDSLDAEETEEGIGQPAGRFF